MGVCAPIMAAGKITIFTALTDRHGLAIVMCYTVKVNGSGAIHDYDADYKTRIATHNRMNLWRDEVNDFRFLGQFMVRL